MQIKKIKTFAVASALVLSMAGVASDTDFFETYPNLTAYNTNYTTTVTKSGSGREDVELRVQGATSAWYPTSLFDSDTSVSNIKWSMVDGSNSAVSIDNANSIAESIAGKGYAAKKTATVDKTGNAGIAVVEAKNTKSGYTNSYMDFTVVVNPDNDNKIQTVSGVNVRAYDKTKGSFKFLKSASGLVNTDNISSTINYPSAMDAIKLVADNNGYTYGVQYGTEFLENVTINNKSYNYSENELGWMYAVYNTSGNLVGVSEKVGAETFDVKSGYTVVWAYVSGYDAGFPSTLSGFDTTSK